MKIKESKIHPVYSTWETLENTYRYSTELLEAKVKGAFIECGVAAGSQVAAMQYAMMQNGESRPIYGFDSFEGIPYAGEHDDSQPGIGPKDESMSGKLVTTGVSAHSLDSVLNNFRNWELPLNNVTFVRGWFQDTVHKEAKRIKSIAMLRLDGDLYESTRVCLESLLPKMSKGGLIIIDDYMLTGARKATLEFLDEAEIEIIGGVGYWYKQ